MKEISWELREQAEELYILDGKTHEEVSEITGIAVQTLKGWSVDGGWSKKRREYRQQIADIRRDSVVLTSKLLKQAMNSLDPQQVFAAVRMKTITARQDKKEDPTVQIDRPKIFLEDMEFVAEILKEIDPEGLKILARNFDVIVTKFKERLKTEG